MPKWQRGEQNMKEIKLTQGKTAIVDDEDFKELSKFKWYCNHGYAVRCIALETGRQKTAWMHTAIMGEQKGLEIDHINGNPLDNRKENLRHVTHAQNQCNSIARGGSSKYKGVCWKKERGKWFVQIQKNGKRCHLGYYKTEQDAAIAYNEAALIHFGAYARLNVIPA